MGLVKTRRLARHSLALGVFASPWVANPRKGRLRDAEAAAGKGRDEAADEGRCREGRSATVRDSAQSSAKSILETSRRICRGIWYNLFISKGESVNE